MIDWGITSASTLVGALVGTLLGGLIVARKTQNLSDRSEQRRMRRDVLRNLAGYRYLLTDPGRDGMFWFALNEIAIAYLDDKTMMDKLREFQEKVERGFESPDLFPLMQAMAESAELPAEWLQRNWIENPFVPSKTEPAAAANDDSPKP